jgi:putative transposase
MKKEKMKKAKAASPEMKRAKKEKVPQQEMKCRKLQLFPTTAQKATMKMWLAGARFAYNLGVEHVNKTHRWGLKSVRDGARVTDEEWEKNAPPHLKKVPYKIRASALLDIPKACATLKAKEGSMHRTLKFRTERDHSYSVTLEHARLNTATNRSMWSPIFGTTKNRNVMAVESGKSLPAKFSHDCRLVYERLSQKFFLCIPESLVAVAPASLNSGRRGAILAIDPGIRTFVTGYDPVQQMVFKCGNVGGRKNGETKGTELLGWLARKSDRLLAKSKIVHGRHRRRIRAVATRIRERIRHLVEELHHKLALEICRSYEVVLLPKFSAKHIACRKTRVIGKRSARKMMQMAPYRFRQTLLHKSREYGTIIILCDEYWTSKTCGVCGMIDPNLKDAKIFNCPHCRVITDRDTNGARNILLRYIAINNLRVVHDSETVYLANSNKSGLSLLVGQ